MITLNNLTILLGHNKTGKTREAMKALNGKYHYRIFPMEGGCTFDFERFQELVEFVPKGSLIFLEQPECGLHPIEHVRLAKNILRAVFYGIHIVLETHSKILLTEIQTAIVTGFLRPDEVSLYWFGLDEHGETQIVNPQFDSGGRYGSWPEWLGNFGDVYLGVTRRYLDAAAEKEFGPDVSAQE